MGDGRIALMGKYTRRARLRQAQERVESAHDSSHMSVCPSLHEITKSGPYDRQDETIHRRFHNVLDSLAFSGSFMCWHGGSGFL